MKISNRENLQSAKKNLRETYYLLARLDRAFLQWGVMKIIGAITGDIIGSVYEWRPIKHTDFPLFIPESRFTDDTVMTVAVADCVINNKDYVSTLQDYGRRHPRAGYGGMFMRWLFSDSPRPYNSFGNGSAMRVSPVGLVFNNLEKVLEEARRSAEITHSHPEGIKGAQATAAAIFLAFQGGGKEEIKQYIESSFDYNLSRTLAQIRPNYSFDVTCQGSVPEAIIAFLESEDYEDAIRNAISLGGDSDTIACITGGIAEAFYGGVPHEIEKESRERLTADLLQVVDEFYRFVGM